MEMVRTASEYKLLNHPEIIERTDYALTSILQCMTAIARKLGVDPADIPNDMTPLTDDPMDDLIELRMWDIAEIERLKRTR